MQRGALDGVVVLEVGGRLAASYASKLLADLGARVVKVEPPEGEPGRHSGEEWEGPSPDGRSALFHYFNANKESVLAEAGFHELAAAAHILIDGSLPGERAWPGCELRVLRALCPALVVVQVSNFGRSGPWRDRFATDLTLQAEAGLALRLGPPGFTPRHIAGELAELVGGTFAAAAALAGLRRASATGAGTIVDVSLHEALLCAQSPQDALVEFLAPFGMGLPARSQANPGTARAADGEVAVNALTAQNWEDLCSLIGAPAFVSRMHDVQMAGEARREFVALLEEWTGGRTMSEIVQTLQDLRIAAASIGDGRSILSSPSFLARGFLVAQPGADFLRPSTPYRLSRTPVTLRSTAPVLGGHARPLPADAITARPAIAGEGGRLPLEGVRVLDLSTFLSGGHCASYLAALGADVVKIESPRRPDGYRFVMTFPEMGTAWWERSPLWQTANLGKRGLAVDLATDEGRAIIEQLVDSADVLVENYAPRVLDAFDLGFERLADRNPRLVMARMPGFGLSGPWRDHVGFAYSFEQLAGMAQNGSEGEPFVQPFGIVDVINGQHAAVAILAALHWRDASGLGQLIELAQVETVACLTADQVIEYQVTGRCRPRIGNRNRRFAPQGVYPCRGEDRWIAVSVTTDKAWRALRSVMGEPTWARTVDLLAAAGRSLLHDQLDARLAEWTRHQDAEDLVERLQACGIAAGVLRTLQEIPSHPQLKARGYHRTVEHPITGSTRYPRHPVLFEFGDLPTGPAPTLGQHTKEILRDELGIDSAAFAELERAGVVASSFTPSG